MVSDKLNLGSSLFTFTLFFKMISELCLNKFAYQDIVRVNEVVR